MGIAFDLLHWATINCQRTLHFLALTLAVFPFMVIGALFALILGLVPSPLLTTLEKINQDHVDFGSQYKKLSDSMIQINRVAEDYYALLAEHSIESKQKNQLIQYLVLEGCRRDHKSNQARCERLEEQLKVPER